MLDHTRVSHMTAEQADYILANHRKCSDLVCQRKLQAQEFMQAHNRKVVVG